MISLVGTRKRKDGQIPSSDKVRIIEQSGEQAETPSQKTDTSNRFPRLRTSLPSNRAFSGIRRGSVKIFSVFRSGKGTWLVIWLCSLLIFGSIPRE